ncbi:hypothetical protein M422DRAFT_272322, partial [Sphaerobolus stellatus SS14]
TTAKGKRRAPTPIIVQSDEDSEDDLDPLPESLQGGPKRSPRTYKSNSKSKAQMQAKAAAPSDSDSDSDSDIVSVSDIVGYVKKKNAASNSASKTKRTPVKDSSRRTEPLKGPDSSPNRTAKTSKQTSSPTKPNGSVTRTYSIHASALEAPSSSSKRGRAFDRDGALRSPSRSRSASPKRRRTQQVDDTVKKPKKTEKAREESVVSPIVTGGRSRRSAAVAATQKLHNEIMPD